MSFGQYYHTLKHLSGDQIWWQVKRRVQRKLFPPKRARTPRAVDLRLPLDKACAFLWGPVSAKNDFENNRFCLLNETVAFGSDVDWAAAGHSRLWGFQLHSFEYLATASMDEGIRLMRSWIRECRDGIGWEAAPVSCRIINWIKFLADRVSLADGSEGLSTARPLDEIGKSLFVQVDWLARNTERHIRGNHLLKNGAALLFAGLFLNQPRFVEQGEAILTETMDEQFLPDGGHYERSTMYHALVMFDLLDCLNLRDGPDTLRQRIRKRIEPGLEFLCAMSHGDGAISLFNDSVFHMVPAPHELIRYAADMGAIDTVSPEYSVGSAVNEPVISAGSKRKVTVSTDNPFEQNNVDQYQPASETTRHFADSGYLVMNTGDCRLIADVGPVGPDSFPAHAHCDLLSFELSLNKRRVIVDSGNFDYQRSEMRKYSRSTRAHNTVAIDGKDQSDMWDIFRVGRRARLLSAELLADDANCTRFSASHDGYAHDDDIVHEREFIRFRHGIFLIIDRISGKEHHSLASYLHFHPDCGIMPGADGPGELTISTGAGDLHIHSGLTGGTPKLEKGWYCPEFNVRKPQTVLAVHLTGELPATLVTCVGLRCDGPVRVDLARRTLHINGSSMRWPCSKKEAICVS